MPPPADPATITVLHVTGDTVAVREVVPDLATMRALVGGGWIEAFRGPGWSGYCDEEGKITGLPVNVLATGIAHALGWDDRADFLCGPVVFLGEPDTRGDDTSVPDLVLDYARTTGALA